MTSPKKKLTTIARLPEASEVNSISDQEKDAALLALIKKGGKSARPQQVEDEEEQEKRISLRLSKDIVDRVKEAANSRPVKTPSHTWIVEAILEKLKKESF